MNYQQQLANSAAIRAEIQRFESVHPNIYSIYELLERVEEPVLQNQIREHVIAIEGVQLNLVDAESQPQPREHRVQMQVHLPLCRRWPR
ncbi:hypothetical protein H8958_020630 [Nasalis larvatus]